MKLFKIPKPKMPKCQDCGIEDSAAKFHRRIGTIRVWGVPMDVTVRLLCARCGEKFDLQTQGLESCEYCKQTKRIGEKCPNCGA